MYLKNANKTTKAVTHITIEPIKELTTKSEAEAAKPK